MSSKHKQLLVVLLTAVLLLSACQMDADTSYPQLTTTGTSGVTNPTKSDTSGDTVQEILLTAALPFDSQTLQALRLLYLAKSSGLISQGDEQYIGLDIQMDDLNQFDTGEISLSIDLLPVPKATGASREQVKIWQASNNLPDILYTRSAADTLGIDQCLDLGGPLYDSLLLQPDRVLISAIEACQSDGVLIAMPFMMSTRAVYLNQAMLEILNLPDPSESWTWEDLFLLLNEAGNAMTDLDLGLDPAALETLADDPEALAERLSSALFVMTDPTPLLDHLPRSYEQTLSWSAWNGDSFSFEHRAYQQALQQIEPLVSKGFTTLHLTAELLEQIPGVHDLVSQGRVLLWIADSSELGDYRQAGLDVRAYPMPNSSTGNLPLSACSLVVPADSNQIETAVDLVAFLALDADALLMMSRFENFDGYVPVLNDRMVWQHLTLGQQDWQWLSESRSRLAASTVSPQQSVEYWTQALSAANQMLADQMNAEWLETDWLDLLARITQESEKILKGGS